VKRDIVSQSFSDKGIVDAIARCPICHRQKGPMSRLISNKATTPRLPFLDASFARLATLARIGLVRAFKLRSHYDFRQPTNCRLSLAHLTFRFSREDLLCPLFSKVASLKSSSYLFARASARHPDNGKRKLTRVTAVQNYPAQLNNHGFY
jgi:hypothetical protein